MGEVETVAEATLVRDGAPGGPDGGSAASLPNYFALNNSSTSGCAS